MILVSSNIYLLMCLTSLLILIYPNEFRTSSAEFDECSGLGSFPKNEKNFLQNETLQMNFVLACQL